MKKKKRIGFPATIQHYRKLRGFTPSEVAQILGVSRQAYFSMERSDRKMIRVSHLKILCKLFHVKLTDLVPIE